MKRAEAVFFGLVTIAALVVLVVFVRSFVGVARDIQAKRPWSVTVYGDDDGLQFKVSRECSLIADGKKWGVANCGPQDRRVEVRVGPATVSPAPGKP